ncbi:divergent polysaccharide deacetylase family protein [Cytobacillus spongiae]|uniref:divergent polysaccharide deacetylase family protein n=1 Tax=Cytobacillus spongiae TaxID=2901381 RepID=UPI001F216B1A|nr:divergent polysaccharide deacetylase family protein [Cytobacillus spongiae]UII54344.1 divergent polysaccharide deacetylase family protein [Cytobacillus spongiae]
MRKLFLLLQIFLFGIVFLPIGTAEAAEDKKAAIIIDDFGGGVGGVREFLEGDIPITAAVMPFTEKSKEHAVWAHKNGFEVMVHLPMEPKRGKRSWLGPKPITADLSSKEVKKRVREAIESVPHALGLNNHMGSLAVENEAIVRAIVEVVKEKKMYIVDSGTSPKSKFPQIAKELGVPIIRRDVFLDDISSAVHVKKQMLELADIVDKEGTGVAIGHVGVTGKVCSQGILQASAEYKKRNIRFVPVSELLSEEIQREYFHMH